MRLLGIMSLALALSACDTSTPSDTHTQSNAEPAAPVEKATETNTQTRITAILENQSETHKTRHTYRHPAETLTFFGIEPGMTVVEFLPGDGWYSQLLVPLLGKEGTLIGVDYDATMWPNFDWVNADFIANRGKWAGEWSAKFSTWSADDAASASAATVSTVDPSFHGQADSVLFIRAMHNMARFEDKGQFLSDALAASYTLLKPGGTVGIVQHQAPEAHSEEWASGAKGYLKKSAIKQAMQNAGFEFVAESNINENQLDQPGEDDVVWRLPPALYTSKDNEELQAQFKAIGESNRMTLLFKKPEE